MTITLIDPIPTVSERGPRTSRKGTVPLAPPRLAKKKRSPRSLDRDKEWIRLSDALLNERDDADAAQGRTSPAVDEVAPAKEEPDEPKNPLDHFQVVETDDAHEAVAQWPIKAVGHRPADYVGREVLLGSLLRDHRPQFFHWYASHCAEWMFPLIEPLAEEPDRAIAQQHVALHYLHRRHLLHRIADQRELGEFADERECTLLANLWSCTPYGVLFDKDGLADRSLRQNCNRTWFCPWCFARRVVDLYERLCRGPLQHPVGKYLVLGRVPVPGNLLDPIGDDLNPTESRAVRKHLGGLLQNAVLRLGVTGGLLTYQLGPWVHDVNPSRYHREFGFQHELAVLGEVELAHPQDVDRLLRQLRAVSPGGQLHGQDQWVVMPALQVNALRLLLVGSGPRFDLRRIEWFTEGENERKFIARKGICGAFALQPLFLLDQRRWQFYRMAVDRMHLFDLFGSWRSALRGGKGEPEEDAFMTDRQRAVQVINGRRQHEVADRRSRLLEVARSLTCQSDEGPTRQRGRPARRRSLKVLLQNHQIEASDRDLRWLNKTLNQVGEVG